MSSDSSDAGSELESTSCHSLPNNVHEESAAPKGRRWKALVLLVMVIAFGTVAELLLKVGANATKQNVGAVSLGISALASWYTIGGIVSYLAAFSVWSYTLKSAPLALAFNFTTMQQVTVMLGAWLLLREVISPLRWVGVAMVIGGVLLLVPAIVAAERKTEGKS